MMVPFVVDQLYEIPVWKGTAKLATVPHPKAEGAEIAPAEGAVVDAFETFNEKLPQSEEPHPSIVT
jgi:hypothetical protein